MQIIGSIDSLQKKLFFYPGNFEKQKKPLSISG
jgi:hypothetical protein